MVLSHDLRNPVQTVTGLGEVLIRRAEVEPRAAFVGERLQRIGRRMVALIDDVLDLARSRLGEGIGAWVTSCTDLEVQLRDVVDEVRFGHPDRRVTRSIMIGVSVVCDRGRLQQLLSNLLANALTHGAPDQPVRVEVKVSGPSLQIAVTNFGPAIAVKALEKVFEPYWRAPGSVQGKGLGLGLYICCEIARAHGGRWG